MGDGSPREMKRLTFVFFLLFLLATLTTAFHHHEDGCEHHDCPVCAAAHVISSASVSSFSITVYQFVSNFEIQIEPLHDDNIRFSLLTSRSPPA
jgi:hypothetical protein